jgi:hypothetical protein
MSRQIDQAALHELVELQRVETDRETDALFPPGSDNFRFVQSLDVAQKEQLTCKMHRIVTQAEERFWQRVRARGLMAFPPRLSSLHGPKARAVGIQVIGFSTLSS